MYTVPGTVPLSPSPPISSQGAYYPSQPPSYSHAPPVYSQSCPPPSQHLYYSSPSPPQVFTAAIPTYPSPPTQVYYTSPTPHGTVVMPTRTVEVNRKEGLSDGDICCLAGLASLAGIFCISSAKEDSDD